MSYYEEQRFKDGVELAHMLNQAIDIDSSVQEVEVSLESLTQINELAEKAEKTATNHQRFAGWFYHNGPKRHFRIPEPYNTISEKADFLFFAAKSGEFLDKPPREYSAELISSLAKAVDELISRDVYVQGSNPNELDQAA